MIDRKALITNWFRNLQIETIQSLEKADGAIKFNTDPWQRPGGGGGVTRLAVNGDVIEKGGVNFSAVHGTTPEPIQRNFNTSSEGFFASGVSIVIHPINPFVPIIHMNVRYFELSDGQAWFGGGIDLTPAYVFEEDARFFHQSLKEVCEEFDLGYYSDYKHNADNYFFIPHRDETRGIGGIFYDRKEATTPKDFEHLWAFTQKVGMAFMEIYPTLIARRKNMPWGDLEKQWQLHRRSRYVEFNLVYDSGTKFGLETNGRTESILMSMPPLARWESFYEPTKGSKEAESQGCFVKGKNWI